jgi:hypothetical protein
MSWCHFERVLEAVCFCSVAKFVEVALHSYMHGVCRCATLHTLSNLLSLQCEALNRSCLCCLGPG